jgi:hypothetical protein
METAMRSLLPVLPVTLLIAPAAAHHGWSSYDSSRLVTLEGPVANLVWQNPHGMIELTQGGKTWHIVLAPITRMMRRGLTEEELKGATSARVEGYPSMKEEAEFRAERIAVGGKTVELR